MQLWRNALLVKITLFFFTAMLFFSPAYAQQGPKPRLVSAALPGQDKLPVVFVDEGEARQIFGNLQRKGYVVREGTLAQLDELVSGAGADQGKVADPEKQECEKAVQQKDQKASRQVLESAAGEPDSKSASEKKQTSIKAQDARCKAQDVDEEAGQRNDAEVDGTPLPEHLPPPQHHPAPEEHGDAMPDEMLHDDAAPRPHGGVGLHVSASGGGGGGGGNSDLAKVFFIVAGVAVVAAFVVYAGKYIVDMVNGKDQKLWSELVFNSTFLSTKSGRSGRFVGAKLATGFVSDELIQLALVGEVGNTVLDLVLNENTNPTPLDFSATYWMLGASARLHLSAKLVNASYLYLEFMGGTTSNGATDIIGTSRLGASFGINDYVRLGASLGAQYIGLNRDQGFANDGDNYWITYGLEIGARF